MASTAASAGDRERRAERRALDEAARLRPNSWSSVEIGMIDLSELGFRARCDVRLQPGAVVSLDVPGLGTIEAQVEWQRRGEFGARFFAPLDLSRCGWPLEERRQALAQLLVQRAGASVAGRPLAEAQLRRRILGALPIRRESKAG